MSSQVNKQHLIFTFISSFVLLEPNSLHILTEDVKYHCTADGFFFVVLFFLFCFFRKPIFFSYSN